MALQQELDATRDRFKRQVADLEERVSQLNAQLQQAQKSQDGKAVIKMFLNFGKLWWGGGEFYFFLHEKLGKALKNMYVRKSLDCTSRFHYMYL